MGFYPVAPASNEYVIGRPFVNRATIQLPNGKAFRVIAEKMSPVNRYVESVTLNGKKLERSYLRHSEIMNGGELRFVMGAKPNRMWAADASSRPYSMSAER
jgi:putative alpha-1,2-mannosidase